MATEAKPFASLSSGLLARKGAARPAMKPQGFGQMGGGNLEDLGWNDMGFEPPRPAMLPARDQDHDAFGEDVVDHPRGHPTGLTPVQSPVHSQQAELVDRLSAPEAEGEPEPVAAEAPAAPAQVFAPEPPPLVVADRTAAVRAVKPRAAPGSKGKAAFTLRLAPDRHLKLRLACAVTGQSAQQLVTDALDAFLDRMPELDAMAQKANRKG